MGAPGNPRFHAHTLAEAEKGRSRCPKIYHFDGSAFGDTTGSRVSKRCRRYGARANDCAGTEAARSRSVCNEIVETIGHLGGRNRAEGYSAALNIERGEDTAVRPCHVQCVERDCHGRHAAGGLGLNPSETSLHLDRGYGA